MALIAMAVYSTEENKKDDCLEKTLFSLKQTVDFKKHRLILSVNSKTQRTVEILSDFADIILGIIYNDTNIGTAEAINKAWRHKRDGEHCVKMDDDVVIHQAGWLDLMEEAIARDSQIGIIGLKRKDLIQTPWHTDPQFKSELKLLPHTAGEKWITVEKTADVMGTCTIYNSVLLDKIGYLKQIKLYGYDDCIACHRAHLSGFYNCFLNHIEIDHIDPGDTPYQDWKRNHSGECTEAYIQCVRDMAAGIEPVYYNPFK